MSEPQFDEQTIRSSLADIAAGMVRYINWFNGAPPRDAYDLIHHAWMQGAHAAEFITADASMNRYGQRQYRMAWFAGFDIGKRIQALAAKDQRIAELEDLRWRAEAAFIAAIHRPEMNKVLVGEVRQEAERILAEHKSMGERCDQLTRMLREWLDESITACDGLHQLRARTAALLARTQETRVDE